LHNLPLVDSNRPQVAKVALLQVDPLKVALLRVELQMAHQVDPLKVDLMVICRTNLLLIIL
tara:strand:+ start:89 stop:271 length:183 start_codon:yes stop_codon:yes gene_type:complete